MGLIGNNDGDGNGKEQRAGVIEIGRGHGATIFLKMAKTTTTA